MHRQAPLKLGTRRSSKIGNSFSTLVDSRQLERKRITCGELTTSN